LASYGMSGQIFHAPFLLADNHFKLTTVLERSKNLSENKIPDVQIVRDFTYLLNDPEIELIVVNTPNQLHFSMSRMALEAGKHVVVEKPFTVSVSEAEELIKLAKNKKLVLAVFHSKRFETDFQTLKRIIHEGKLGNIKLFESNFFRWKPEIGNKLWKVKPGPGSGILYDLGSHLIDQALLLFGKPKSIFADLGVFRKGALVNDYFELIFDYGSKKTVLKSFLLSAIDGPRFSVYGDKAAYIKYGVDIQENILAKGIIPGTNEWDSVNENQEGRIHSPEEKIAFETVKSDYQEFYRNIYQVIREGAELLIKPEEACDVIRMIELAILSHEQKRVIEL